jgi:hypothetical protein
MGKVVVLQARQGLVTCLYSFGYIVEIERLIGVLSG